MKRKLASGALLSCLLLAGLSISAQAFADTGTTNIDANDTGATNLNLGDTGTTHTTGNQDGTTNVKANDTGTTNINGTGGSGTLSNPLNASSLGDLVAEILKALEEVGYVLVVLALVYCGFLFVAAQGNEEKIRDARGALLWTVIGGLVLVGATAIQAVIVSTAQAL